MGCLLHRFMVLLVYLRLRHVICIALNIMLSMTLRESGTIIMNLTLNFFTIMLLFILRFLILLLLVLLLRLSLLLLVIVFDALIE